MLGRSQRKNLSNTGALARSGRPKRRAGSDRRVFLAPAPSDPTRHVEYPTGIWRWVGQARLNTLKKIRVLSRERPPRPTRLSPRPAPLSPYKTLVGVFMFMYVPVYTT